MTDYRSFYDSDYIGAWDLETGDRTVTIKEVKRGELVNEKGKKNSKAIIFFQGAKKGFAAGKASTNVIASLYGNRVEDWIGKRITLYVTEVDAYGKTVQAIRVRPRIPPAAAPRPAQAPPPNAPLGEAPAVVQGELTSDIPADGAPDEVGGDA